MPGYVAISGIIVGVTAGSYPLGPYTTAAATSANLGVSTPTLVSGANTITVPSWNPAGVVIVPSPANTQTLTIKGVTGDTGVNLSPINATMLSFPASPPATFVLTAGGNFTTVTSIIFF